METNPDQEKAVRYRRSWRRVARRVLVSKNPETRKRWAKALVFVASYIRKNGEKLNKKKLNADQKSKLDAVTAEASLYRKMVEALKGPAKDGDDKLADQMLGKRGKSKPKTEAKPKEKPKASVKVPVHNTVESIKLKRTLLVKRGREVFDAYHKAKADGDTKKQEHYKELYGKLKTALLKTNDVFKKAVKVAQSK